MDKKNNKWLFRVITLMTYCLFLNGCDNQEDDFPYPDRKLEDIDIVISDIDLFWSVFDKANGEYTPERFEDDYFFNGTNGLEQYFYKKVQSAEAMTNKLNNEDFLKYYTSIRTTSVNLDIINNAIRNSLILFDDLYDDANFSDVYLLMGSFAAGGTVLQNGDIAVGVEFFMDSQDSNTLGLPNYLKEVLKTSDFIPTIVIHELVHFQQLNFAEQEGLNLSNRSLLEVCISEGVSEYIAFLVTDRFTTMHLTDYFSSNEEELKQRFISEMNSSDYSNWLFNLGSGIDIPADLGYYIGFKIAEKHYENYHSIERLIEIEDANQFLEESRYFE
jgi:hypothetical protein